MKKRHHHHGPRALLTGALITTAALAASAQEGEVRILVQPWKQTEFVLDGAQRMGATPALLLPEGPHNLVFWAPHCSLWDTTVAVKAGERIELRKVLKRTPEYLAHERDLAKASFKKAALRYIPLTATIAFGAWALAARNKHDQAYDELQQAASAYHTTNSPGIIAYDKAVTLPAAKERLQDTRNTLVLSVGLCGTAALATVYGFLRAAKVRTPEYQDKEKLRFEGLVFVPDARGGMLMTGLTLPLR
ncbi:MAG TPA: hypothetical protein VGE21_16030 [Flavobacteriales bacterium]